MSVRYIVFLACVLACAVGHAAILLSAARKRAAPVESPQGIPRPHRAVEIFWALLPALVLAIVLTATWNRVQTLERATHRAHEIMKVAR